MLGGFLFEPQPEFLHALLVAALRVEGVDRLALLQHLAVDVVDFEPLRVQFLAERCPVKRDQRVELVRATFFAPQGRARLSPIPCG